MTSEIVDLLVATALEIGDAVQSGVHQGYSGQRATQYHLDIAADEIAVRMLRGAGMTVVSEESGVSQGGDVTVVVDPIDGSTNCDHGIPFYATSLAAVRRGELVAGVVRNQATGTTYAAELNSGATRDGLSITVSSVTEISSSIVAFSGLPYGHLGWAQYRALGAASLEICLVADGSIDAYSVARRSTLRPWDYLGGLLILSESGGVYQELNDQELVTVERSPLRPVFAATSELLVTLSGLIMAND